MSGKIKNIFDYSDSNIEIIGTKRVIVEDMVSIVEYNDNQVRLDIGKHLLTVAGSGLKINDYFNKNVIIDGNINAVSFE